MNKILNKKYFQNKNTVKLAKNLLGKFLVRRYRGKTTAYMIMEVEAYDGFRDKASHAHRGKTERNKIMYGSSGYWYVYFTYGMHYMLNIVTGPKDYPAAILIRSIKIAHPVAYGEPPACGEARSGRRLRQESSRRTADTTINGPARLTKALKIDKKLNSKPATLKSGLWIIDKGTRPIKIKKSPRIGVNYAGPTWANKKYRFYLE